MIVPVYFSVSRDSALPSRSWDLVGTAEVAEMLGVTRGQVHRLSSHRDFPKPVAVLSAGKVWRRSDIEWWNATRRRRPGRPEKPYPPR